MAIPDKQTLQNEEQGLAKLAPTDREAILTSVFIAFLNGAPLDPDTPAQELVTFANQLQCLSSPVVEAIMIRKIMAILFLLDGFLGSILFGNGSPEEVVEGARAIYVDMQTPAMYFQPSTTPTDTGWVALVI